MPKQAYQNPLYVNRSNDPAVGAIGNNIAALLLGGQSPNERADAEAKAALGAAQAEEARQAAREHGGKADLTEMTVSDLLNVPATVQAQQAAMNALPEALRPQAQTLYSRRLNDDPAKIDDARRLNVYDAAMNRNGTDFAGPLGISPGEVGTRQAALGAKPLYGEGGEGQILQHFTGDVGQTPVSRANVAKTGAETTRAGAETRRADAEARKADAEALSAPFKTPGRKPPKDMQPTGEVDANGNPKYEVIPGSPTHRKMTDDMEHDKKVLDAANTAYDNIINTIDKLTGPEARYKDVSGVTGPFVSKIPGTRNKGTADFMHTLGAEQVLGVIQNLKSQSASGQTGIGRVLQSEIPLFRDSIAPIASGQTDTDTLNNLKTLRAAAQASKERINSGFESEYAGAGGGGSSLPPGVTEDDVQETMRANKLTRDQVLQRLGRGR